jgi:hypothetical protein
MSRFKSYINPVPINDNKNEQNPRHITQVKTYIYINIRVNLDIKITIGADDHNDKPPIPPTRHPMINRLTSSIDESLVNLSLLSQDALIEQERALYELEQIFIQFRRYIEKSYHQYEYEIKSSYANYDQHIYELISKLKHVREELIQSCISTNDNDDYLFDINKYHYLEMLTTQTLNQTMKEKKILPKYQFKLNNLNQLNQIFVIQSEQKPLNIISQTDNTNNNTDLSREITPIQRSLSIG